MATIRLIPSAYSLSNTSYLSISNASNMYTNIDSTTYAILNHTRNYSTTSYYIYVKGFNFDDIPADAIINSAIVKVKAKVKSARCLPENILKGGSRHFAECLEHLRVEFVPSGEFQISGNEGRCEIHFHGRNFHHFRAHDDQFVGTGNQICTVYVVVHVIV